MIPFLDSFEHYTSGTLADRWATPEPQPGTPVIGLSRDSRQTVSRDGLHVGSVPLVAGVWYEDLYALVLEATMWGDEPPVER